MLRQTTAFRGPRWISLCLALILASANVAGNDDCADAIVIDVGDLPSFSVADTTTATVDFAEPADNLMNLTCRVSSVSRGVWYKLTGTDALLEAKVQTDDPDVAIRTALFVGESCGDWKCLRPDADYELMDDRTTPTSTWFAREGEKYWLHVTGVNASDVGMLEISIGVSRALHIGHALLHSLSGRAHLSCLFYFRTFPLSPVVALKTIDATRHTWSTRFPSSTTIPT